MKTEYYVVERLPGAAFTTFTDRNGEQHRVLIDARRFGPFSSTPEAADWLSKNSSQHASYVIEVLEATE